MSEHQPGGQEILGGGETFRQTISCVFLMCNRPPTRVGTVQHDPLGNQQA